MLFQHINADHLAPRFQPSHLCAADSLRILAELKDAGQIVTYVKAMSYARIIAIKVLRLSSSEDGVNSLFAL